MPVAITSTRTSPALGPPISMVSMVSGWPAFQATAARVFMAFPQVDAAGVARWLPACKEARGVSSHRNGRSLALVLQRMAYAPDRQGNNGQRHRDGHEQGRTGQVEPGMVDGLQRRLDQADRVVADGNDRQPLHR